MAVTKERLIIEIKADTDDGRKAVDDFNKSLDKIGKSGKVAKKSVKDLGGAFRGAGASMVVLNQALELAQKALNAFNATIGRTIQDFAAFEKALVGVGKTTDLTGQSLEMFGDSMKAMSERIPVSTESLLDLAQTAGQLGISGADNLENFTETVAKLSATTDLTGEQASTALARILTVTEQGIDKVDEFGSVIVALGNNFAATESEILKMTSEVVKGTSIFGVGAEKAAAMSTALKVMGVQSELAGSVVGRVFRTIQASLKAGGEEMATLSRVTRMSGAQLKKTFQTDATAVFQSFVRGLGQAQKSGTDIIAVLETMGLKGDENLKVIPTLAKSFTVLDQAMVKANKEMGNATALNEEAQKAFNTLAANMETTLNAIRNLSSEIGKLFAPVVISGLQMLKDAIITARKALKALSEVDYSRLIQEIKVLGAALLVFATPALASGITAVASGIAALAAPIVLVTAKFAALIIAADLMLKNLGRLPQLGKLFVDAFVFAFQKGIELILELVSFALQKINEFLFTIGKAFPKASKIILASTEFITKGIIAIESQIVSLGDKSTESFKKMQKSSEDVNLGLLGSGIDFINQLTKKYNNTVKKLGYDTDNTADNIREFNTELAKTPKTIAQQIDELREINKIANTLIDLRLEALSLIPKEERTARQQAAIIDLQAEKRLLNLKLMRDEIKAADKLTPILSSHIAELEKAIKKRRQIEKTAVLFTVGDLAKNMTNAAQNFGKTLRKEVTQLDKMNFDEEIFGDFGAFINKQLDKIDFTFIGNVLGDFFEGMDFTSDLNEMFASINIPEVLDGLNTAITGAFEIGADIVSAVVSFFDPDNMKRLAETITNFILNLPELMMEATKVLISALDKFIEKGAMMFQRLIEMMPAAIQNLLDRLPQIVSILMDALISLVDSLPQRFDQIFDKLDEILGRLLDKLPDLIRSIFKAIPKIAQSFFANLPDILVKIIDAIPSVVEAFVAGFIEAVPGIIVAMVNELILRGGIFKIARSLIVALVRLVPALAKGLAEGIKNAVKNIFTDVEFPAFENFKDTIDEGVNKITKTLTGATSEIFRVADLAAEARGIDTADKIRNAILSSLGVAAKRLDSLWTNMLDKMRSVGGAITKGIEDVFKTLDKYLIKPLSEALSGIWSKLYEKLLKPLEKGVKDVFMGAVKHIFDPLGNFLMKVFGKAVENIIMPITEGLKSAFEKAGEFLKDPITKILTGFESAIKGILTGVSNVFGKLFGGLGKIFKKLFNGFSKFFDAFKIGPIGYNISAGRLGSWSGDLIKQIDLLPALKLPEFAMGGHVGTVAGASGTGDSVLGMLDPREFVVNPTGVKTAGMEMLKSINRGERPVGDKVEIGNLNVEVKTDRVDEHFVRTRLMPVVKEELRRGSLEGRRILSPSGVR